MRTTLLSIIRRLEDMNNSTPLEVQNKGKKLADIKFAFTSI